MAAGRVDTVSVGLDGEGRACDYLLAQGYKLICRNYRFCEGEIDIVALKGEVLVFFEVKTLPSGGLDTLAWELGKAKQRRIIKTAKYFLSVNRQYSNAYVRFDVLVVDMPGYPEVYHIENAFTEDL